MPESQQQQQQSQLSKVEDLVWENLDPSEDEEEDDKDKQDSD